MVAETPTLIFGDIFHFLTNPGMAIDTSGWELIPDGALLVEHGKIVATGTRAALSRANPTAQIQDFRGRLIMPGFIDTHVHYAQLDVIASFGSTLLDWLERYTFPAEAAFADEAHAVMIADLFLDELLKNGTTTGSVFPTVHATSVDAFFSAAHARQLRMQCGKVMMDRHCPSNLQDTVASAERDNLQLIEKWHQKGRLDYTLTPRFAPTSSDAQLAMTGELLQAFPSVRLQSHLAENPEEIAWVKSLFPQAKSYLDVYAQHGLLGDRSIFAHSVHLDTEDKAIMGSTSSSIAFCPTSNLFLGSGFFDLNSCNAQGIKIGLASDIGGGTSLSMFHTMAAAYKVLQYHRQPLTPWQAFYLATLGGATALGLEKQIGNFEIGKEADFIVIDEAATPLLARRTSVAKTLGERLFALMMLGDDRTIEATFILGKQQILHQ